MSGVTGMQSHVPKGWQLVQMQDVAAAGKHTFIGGPFGSDLTRADYVPEPGVPVIRGSNLDGKESRFIDDDFAYVSDAKAATLEKNMAYPGDVVFTQRGTLGQVALIPKPARFSRYVISQSQMKVTLNPKRAVPRYIYHYYRSPLAAAYLNQRVLATGVPHISLSILKQFPVLLPPLPEQRRIAAILDKADAIRRKRQETIRLTEEFLRSAFLDMFGDPVTNPKGWPVKEMNDIVAETQYGTASPCNELQDGLPILRMNNITYGGDIDLRQIKWCPIGSDERPKYTVSKGDLLFDRTNSPELVGKCAVWNHDEDYAFAGYLIRVRFKESVANPHYVSGFLNSPYGKRILFVKAKPSMSNFSAGEFIKISIPVPPLRQQISYANLVQRARRARTSRATALASSDSLFSALVSAAFTGAL